MQSTTKSKNQQLGLTLIANTFIVVLLSGLGVYGASTLVVGKETTKRTIVLLKISASFIFSLACLALTVWLATLASGRAILYLPAVIALVLGVRFLLLTRKSWKELV